MENKIDVAVLGQGKMGTTHVGAAKASSYVRNIYGYERMPKVDKGHYNEIDYFRKIIIEDRYPDTDAIKGAVANLIAWKAIESWEKGIPLCTDFSLNMEIILT